MTEQLHVLVGVETGVLRLSSENSGQSWSAPEVLIDQVEACALQAAPDGSVYVGTRGQGIFRIQPGMREWTHLDTPDELTKTRSLYIGEDHFLAGTEPARVFEWENGERWVPFGEMGACAGAPSWWYPVQGEDAHIRHLSRDPHQKDRFYGAIQVGGVAISPDAGDSWYDRRNLDLDVHMVVAHPGQPGTVFAGSGGKGLLRSRDWGDTWEEIAGPTGNFVVQFAMHPAQPDRIFLGTARGGVREWRENPQVGASGEVYRSDDGGDSWRRLTNGLPEHMQSRIDTVVVDPTNADCVLIGGGGARRSGATDGGIYFSADAGDSWQRIANVADPLSMWCVRD